MRSIFSRSPLRTINSDVNLTFKALTAKESQQDKENKPLINLVECSPKQKEQTNIIIVEFPEDDAQSKNKTTINDFVTISLLGRGAYAKVVLAQHLYNDKYYALKIVDKHFLNQLNKQHEVFIERSIITSLNHPNIIKLNLAFHDKHKLYFVMEYCENKDLSLLVKKYVKLPINLIKYYIAEIVSALQYIHSKNIIHLDIKPENIGITSKMHTKLLDFGNAMVMGKFFDKKTLKFVSIDKERIKEYYESKGKEAFIEDEIKIDNYQLIDLRRELVGTTNYVSPEMLSRNYDDIGPGCDLWALGVIIYYLYHGKTPFETGYQKSTFQNILNCKYEFDSSIPNDAKDLISNLLIKDPKERIGVRKGYEELKSHPFFKDINFQKLATTSPPLIKTFINTTNKYMGRSVSPTKRGIYIRQSSFAPRQDKDNSKITATNRNEGDLLMEDELLLKAPFQNYDIKTMKHLKLFSNGMIEYYEGEKMNKGRGYLMLDDNCTVEMLNDYSFKLKAVNRSFCFEDMNNKKAKYWVENIKRVISEMKSRVI